MQMQEHDSREILETDLRNDARLRFQGPLWEAYDYEAFRPAYEYGVELAGDERFGHHNLHELDEFSQGNWKGEYPFTWINIKEAIEYGFARARAGSTNTP